MLIDIAFNASSREYQNSLPEVFARSAAAGVLPIIVGLDLESSRAGARQAQEFATASYFGIHPTSFINAAAAASEGTGLRYAEDKLWIDLECGTVDAPRPGSSSDCDMHLPLTDVLFEGISGSPAVIAVGECGLDYYRKSNRAEQVLVFKAHLALHTRLDLPFFFHCRHAFDDFIASIDACEPPGTIRGVVHSFDGSLEEAEALIERGLYIGINGCSLRSVDSIDAVRAIPLDRMLLETDSPYCLIRGSYAGSKYTSVIKARHNQPYYLSNVAAAVANIKGIGIEEVEKTVYRNTLQLFPRLTRILKN
ncbi:TatD DNase family protein [Pancytospora philotis]|nr:TatD DNase family protein [Pancytospora philotis]